MKTWVKALVWFGFGGGIGFFAGYQLGARSKAQEGPGDSPDQEYAEGIEAASEAINRASRACNGVKSAVEAVNKAFKDYRGEDTDGDDTVIDSLPEGWENDPLTVDETIVETVPEDIPQLHPESMEPYPITKEEFESNPEFYEQKLLSWYEGDEVLFDEEYSEIIPVPEDVLGIGAILGFGGDPNNPAETIYIRNDTMGTLYRVDLVHGSFYGMVETPEGPDETDWEDEEDGM